MTDQEQIDAEHDRRSWASLRRLALVLAVCAAAMLFGIAQCAHADSYSVTWNASVGCARGDSCPLRGYEIQTAPTILSTTWTTLGTVSSSELAFPVKDLSIGTHCYRVIALISDVILLGKDSDPSPVHCRATLEPAKPNPPTILTLKTIGGEVRNTGTFDPKAWAVRSNKPYGTIGADVACDASKAAVDGWYRVPSAQVKWASSKAITPYPLAKCELRP